MRNGQLTLAIQPPCKDCADRTVTVTDDGVRTCHGSCERYAEYRKKLDEMNADRQKRWERTMPTERRRRML